MKRIMTTLAVVPLLFALAGCAGMTTTEQRMLSGGAIGAAGGAAIGAAAGNPAAGAAIGGAAGVIGGAIYDDIQKRNGNE